MGHKKQTKSPSPGAETPENIYGIYRPEGPYRENLCPRYRGRPKVAGRELYLRLGRYMTFIFFLSFMIVQGKFDMLFSNSSVALIFMFN